MLLAVVGHEDDVAVGGPDEAGQLEVVLGAGRGGLHRGHLVGLDAAQLGGRVQHADAAQQTGVHLEQGGYWLDWVYWCSSGDQGLYWVIMWIDVHFEIKYYTEIKPLLILD